MSLLDGGDIGNDGRIQLDSGANFSLSGTITNEGLIALNGSPGSGASLAIAGTATLAGGGVVQLSDDPDNQIVGTTRFGGLTTLVNVNNTIEGGGTIGNIPSYNQYTSLALVNHGTVDANVSTPLTLYLGSGSTNDGTMQASNGGTLIFASGPLDNTGGTIQALDGSTVAFQGSASYGAVANGLITAASGGTVDIGSGPILGVQLVSSAGGLVKLDGGTVLDSLLTGPGGFTGGGGQLTDSTVDFGTTIQVTSLNLSGTITNEGLIALNGSPGSGASLAIAGTATLAGGGVVQLSDDPDNQIVGTTRFGGLTTLVNVNNTIEGGGTIGNIPSYNQYTSLALVNHGTVDANVSTPLTLYLGSGSTNDGTMQASNGGTLIFASGPLDNTGGTIQALDGSTVAFEGATLSNLQGPTLVSGSYKVQGLQSAATLDLGRGIATNQASIVVSGGLATFTSLTPLANNTGSLQFDSGAQFTTQGDFVNTGTLRILGAQSAFNVNGNFSQAAGLTLLNGGQISASGMLNVSGGSFGGQGTIQGAVNISDGVLQIGASPDSLTIAGAFDQTGGTVRFEVYEEPNGSFETDTLILQDPFSSNISGAKVIFDFVGAANPEDFFKTGDFSLLSFVDLSGGTDASGLSRIFAGDQYEIMSDDFQVKKFVFSAADGAEQLQIATAGAVPEPGTWMMLFEGAALLGCALRTVRRRRVG